MQRNTWVRVSSAWGSPFVAQHVGQPLFTLQSTACTSPLSVLWLELCLQVSRGKGGASLLKNETRLLHVPQGCWWGSATCTEELQDLAGRWAAKSPATCHDASGLCAQGSTSPPQSQCMTTSHPQHFSSCRVPDLLHPLSSHDLLCPDQIPRGGTQIWSKYKNHLNYRKNLY